MLFAHINKSTQHTYIAYTSTR